LSAEDPIAVLHEDRDVVAVAKPAGPPVIPARGEDADACVQRRLERQLGRRLWVVHRIDRDASGVVLFARNADAHRALSLAFERREVHKSYVAIVAGRLSPPAGRIDVALHAARKGKTRPAQPGEPGAQEAATDYAAERTWRVAGEDVTRVTARPLTGRHHQIRVHLRFVGAPILFDPLYGRGFGPKDLASAPASRLALHAARLDVPAPSGGGRLVVDCPLAADLAALVEWLDARDETTSA
jgi:tRNA pseudouridine32 synthase / 23S rRNA pseudouridine746 synthase